MRTRRHATVGAIAATVLLLAATACSSGSEDSTGESLPAVEEVEATEATPGTATPGTAAPGTDAPGATTATASPDDTDTDDPATTEPAVVVPDALQFTAPLVGGGTFDGAAVAGKPTVFWFWAPT